VPADPGRQVLHKSLGFVPTLEPCTNALRRGCTRGRQPSCGGSRSHDACQRFWLARSVLPAWGEPARPGFPLGENGKGGKIPCCRRLMATPPTYAARSRPCAARMRSPHRIELIERLFPILDNIPFRTDVTQRPVQQLESRLFVRKRPARFDDFCAGSCAATPPHWSYKSPAALPPEIRKRA